MRSCNALVKFYEQFTNRKKFSTSFESSMTLGGNYADICINE